MGFAPMPYIVETFTANIVPMERIFFHIVLENQSKGSMEIQWVRFDVVNSKGILFSGQYSGTALTDLFDSAMDRRRIEPSTRQSLNIAPGERKAISDIFLDFPKGFVGENLLVEVDYKSGGKEISKKALCSTHTRRRVSPGGCHLKAHGMSQRSTAIWIRTNGSWPKRSRTISCRSAQTARAISATEKPIADYYAYGKKVLAAKDGIVVSVRSDVAENVPGETTNLTSPGGNVVVIDHGNNQFGYYAHLKPFTVAVKAGAHVKAGDVLGEVGNSGDSPEPHLHFHVMNNADPGQGDGIPLVFEKWKAEAYGRFPVSRQLGILPRGEFVQP